MYFVRLNKNEKLVLCVVTDSFFGLTNFQRGVYEIFFFGDLRYLHVIYCYIYKNERT